MLSSARRRFGVVNLRPYLPVIAILAVLSGLFIWRIGSLTPGFSPTEASATSASASFQSVIDNPVNAPHKIIQLAFRSGGDSYVPNLRLASVVWAVVLLLCFYYIANCWFGKMVGFWGTLMLAGTPLFILVARSARPDIMLLSPLLLVAAYRWLTRTKNKPNLVFSVLCLTTAICLYAPGGIWFVLIAIGMAWTNIRRLISQINPAVVIVSLALAILLITPLLIAIFKEPSIIKQLMLIPTSFSNVMSILSSTGWSILSLLIYNHSHNELMIGHLAILSAAQLALLLFGLYAMYSQARKELIYLLCFSLLAVIISGINQNISYLLLALPGLGLILAAGLRYLFIEWRTIFPKNPIPKGLAISLMTILVIMQLGLGFRYSLIAWPNTQTTKNLYVIK